MLTSAGHCARRSSSHLAARIVSYVRPVDKEAALLTLANRKSEATMPVCLSGLKERKWCRGGASKMGASVGTMTYP